MSSSKFSTSKERLLSSTVVPIMVGIGVAVGGYATAAATSSAPARTNGPATVADLRAGIASNPTAAANPHRLPVQVAACNPCNPCAAKKCNPCNPCAAKCNPCGASACNPCNPCGACGPCGAGGVVSAECVVPRLQQAAACNPCAAKCNPCGAKACNPCNPCAAKCNPCSAKACNPCAAKACNPCNPCAAKACNPCNPCAAKNPCNPCGACGPCGAAGVKLTDAEAAKAYDCLLRELKAAYAKSGHKVAKSYARWKNFATQAYQSDTHGSRYVTNYANRKAAARYAKFEKVKKMAKGGILAKDSFAASADGKLMLGPLFVMEKMGRGFYEDSGDWRYTMIMPDGTVVGTTKGKGSDAVEFCYGCHIGTAEETADSLLFLPAQYRKK